MEKIITSKLFSVLAKVAMSTNWNGFSSEDIKFASNVYCLLDCLIMRNAERTHNQYNPYTKVTNIMWQIPENFIRNLQWNPVTFSDGDSINIILL